MTEPFAPTVAAIVALLAAAVDVRTRRIPNALTLGAAVLAIGYHASTGGLPGAGRAAGGWLVGAAMFFPVFALGGMGAGDVKLVAALGAWLGPSGALTVAVGSAIAGGILGVLISLQSNYLGTALSNIRMLLMFWRVNGLKPKPDLTLAASTSPRLAYAVPILLGTLGALWLR